jgi:hypothetical protein
VGITDQPNPKVQESDFQSNALSAADIEGGTMPNHDESRTELAEINAQFVRHERATRRMLVSGIILSAAAIIVLAYLLLMEDAALKALSAHALRAK